MALVNSLVPSTAGGGRVWSTMTAGKGSTAEIVAPAKKLLLEVDAEFVEHKEPDNNMDMASEVPLAVGTAAGGSRWLCDPSYLVINTVGSSAQRWTYI